MAQDILKDCNTGWSYSDVTKAMSKSGGPEKFIDNIYNNGYKAGYKDCKKKDNMLVVGVSAFVIGYGLCKLKQYIQRKLAEAK